MHGRAKSVASQLTSSLTVGCWVVTQAVIHTERVLYSFNITGTVVRFVIIFTVDLMINELLSTPPRPRSPAAWLFECEVLCIAA